MLNIFHAKLAWTTLVQFISNYYLQNLLAYVAALFVASVSKLPRDCGRCEDRRLKILWS